MDPAAYRFSNARRVSEAEILASPAKHRMLLQWLRNSPKLSSRDKIGDGAR
jgi:hypothetical protein